MSDKLIKLANKIKSLGIIFIILLLIIVGFFVGYFIGVKRDHQKVVDQYLNSISPVRESDLPYKFIKPLLTYNIPSSQDEKEFSAIKDEINDLIDKKKKTDKLTGFSLFISELDKGRWIGVNEAEKYSAASLWKVTLMMAYYKKAQTDNNILSQKLIYSKPMNDLTVQSKFDTPSELEIDKTYTIDDLINKMIIDSDNGAKTLLLANIEDSYMNTIYADLTVPNPETTNYVVSPLDYSLFFRVLYNSSYLYKTMSEKALELLSKTTFNDGLVAGLPAGITVSHKYGERIINSNDQIDSVELHDCGIVYYRPSPYFICIMTEGTNIDDLKNTIKEVSGLLYNKISNKI